MKGEYANLPGLLVSDELDETTERLIHELEVPVESAATELPNQTLKFEFAGSVFCIDPHDLNQVVDALDFEIGSLSLDYDSIEAEKIIGTILSFVPDSMFNTDDLFEVLMTLPCEIVLQNICDRTTRWGENRFYYLLTVFGLKNLPKDFLKKNCRNPKFRQAAFSYDRSFQNNSEQRKFLAKFYDPAIHK